jgi:endonuclease/exonuclease/phosphatase (EEP) superfamily protein YafD
VKPEDRSAFGSGVFSRHPITDSSVVRFDGFPTVRATIELHDRPSGVDELTVLAEGEDGPLLLAGDFNVTRQHRPFRQLLGTDLRDAHLETGRGRARTWPAGRRLPPFALLDHVLVSPHFAVDATAEVDVPGSDHRAVVADLRWAR